MVDFIEDKIIYPAMIRLSACLCLEIEASGLPATCSCGPMIGNLVLDYCGTCADGKCGGQAWVRLVEAFPTVDFPSQALELRNCASPLAYQLEVGIVRCRPVGTVSGVRGYTPPTLEQNVEALRLQLADMAAMRRAVECCFGDAEIDYILGSYNPITVEGDCLGGVFTVYASGEGSW
jgi:hypothetical protein